MMTKKQLLTLVVSSSILLSSSANAFFCSKKKSRPYWPVAAYYPGYYAFYPAQPVFYPQQQTAITPMPRYPALPAIAPRTSSSKSFCPF
jgi:hypothetical protein